MTGVEWKITRVTVRDLDFTRKFFKNKILGKKDFKYKTNKTVKKSHK